MNYHNIQKDDMLNGAGIRVVLFISGCTHNCHNCHNPQTHDFESGVLFDEDALSEIYRELEKDYISGLTLSGGDPLNDKNLEGVLDLCLKLKENFPNKSIWCYTGYTWEELQLRIAKESRLELLLDSFIDVIVDGRFIEDLKDVNYPFAGSTNQRVIDVKATNESNKVVIWKN